ncbi:MAG: hypothetical protein EOS81_10655 [Mesorhizobium sp.]|uniref:hypothetical protein n=1 Tax=unclassified Mesorhizobium TaxID=325217 RepID=UPI000F750D2E|nr:MULTISPECIES: hypothetical protein [unclassified Mesorhizobium]RVC66826.1 hypothetical protein EN759_17460 [Mesorhizobium sp. M00.F.Ca.ET.038.03.1.1]RVC76082.1 hypothetical protein EN766_14630 [Mesorhizobium sp. M2A.F.Ca.ET.046.02.1.1]AZO38631.1 hypothetical protein EJ072_32395 [Mesorhizobium sp. M2A.F.Ca.ET.046.03.2.1]RWB37625.1 MAG: hypothetical protein EOQ44_32855 [Mesorhizobium sp.]RWE17932.1 MAG: hypothetical protein EOS76_17820 [Mesorhizobium sp.]
MTERAAILAELASIAAAVERLAGLLTVEEPSPDPPIGHADDGGRVEPPRKFDGHDMVTPHIAQLRTGIPQNTIRKWCQAEGIGEKRGAGWVVSMQELHTRVHRRRKAA